MAKILSESTGKTAKRKAPATAWKKGQSGNPGGRPKNDNSISHWLQEFGKMSPSELSVLFAQYADQLKQVKGNMPIFAHIAIRALMEQVNSASPGVFAIILERTEGKVADKVELYDWRKDAQAAGLDPDALVTEFFAKVKHDAANGDNPQP